MKVLMTADAVGGVWQYALELIRALEPHGVEVVLATMGNPPDAQQRNQAKRLGNVRLCAGNYKLEWMNAPWHDVAAAGEWLLELESRCDADVVHLNGYAHGALPWRAPVMIVGHSCVLSWWAAVRGGKPPSSWDRYRHEVAAGLRAADLVAAPSRAMLDSLLWHYGPLPRARVIHNSRSSTDFTAARKDPLIFSAGRMWDDAKNLSALAQVAAALPWPTYVAGEDRGPEGNSVPADSVLRLGRLSSEGISSWLARAAIFAHPARYEPFGLSVLEAGLSGCALVLGDIASLREIWGDAATYAPPDNPGALQAALLEMIERPARRACFAHAALIRARNYSPRRMAREYFAAYTDLVAAAPPHCQPMETSCAS